MLTTRALRNARTAQAPIGSKPHALTSAHAQAAYMRGKRAHAQATLRRAQAFIAFYNARSDQPLSM